jgi:type II secretory pathway pseudopilin PulG
LSAIARILSRARTRAGDERGWLMVELMVGAVVLVIAGLGIYQGLDRASTASGQNRNRSVAAYLAQQDQERMRTLDTSVLVGYITTPSVRSVNVGGTNYTVTSNVYNANDSNGVSTSCTSASTLATYLKISSTVVDPTGKNGPVKLDSLLSPRSDQGGAAVQIVDRTGTNGVSGIPVTLVEAPSLSGSTDTSGCVQFGFLRGTDYHVSFSQGGYVDKDGNNAITNQPITVVTGTSSLTQFMYDLGGAMTASFRDTTGANNTARGRGFTVFQSGLSGNQERSFMTGTSLTDAASATAQNAGTFTSPMTLFPFTSSYSIWAGTCDAAKPTGTGAGYIRSGIVPPGGTLALNPATTYLAQPKVSITVQNRTVSGGSFSNLGTADVYVKDVCGATYGPIPYSGSSGIYASGFPFGALTVCADDNKSTSRYETGTVTNTAGTNSLTLQIDSFSGGNDLTGSCTSNGPWS